MNPAYYVPIIIMLLVIFLSLQRSRKTAIARKMIKNKRSGDRLKMIELAKRFIGKECLLSSFDGNHQYEGVIKEVVGGAVLLEKDEKTEIVNLDFIIRIREYPKNKKGNKKTFISD